jgi:benzoate-CoA ligase
MIQTVELYARPILGIDTDDIVFSAAKLSFAYGLGNALTFPMAVGATAVLLADRPTPSAVFGHLRKYRPCRGDSSRGNAEKKTTAFWKGLLPFSRGRE